MDAVTLGGDPTGIGCAAIRGIDLLHSIQFRDLVESRDGQPSLHDVRVGVGYFDDRAQVPDLLQRVVPNVLQVDLCLYVA